MRLYWSCFSDGIVYCDLHNAIKDSTQTIVDGQKQAEMRELQNKIDALREENSTFKSSAMTSQIVGQAVAPINQVLAGLQNEVAGIKCSNCQQTDR